MNVSRAVFIFFAALVLTAGCSRRGADGIQDADLRLAATDPVKLPSVPVSEDMAQALISELNGWGSQGKEFVESLYTCSARAATPEAGKVPKDCDSDYDIDPACLLKHGIGRKTVHRVLEAERVDLNKDGVPDYLISASDCMELTANSSNAYFVMLSQGKNEFHLAYADVAIDQLLAVENPAGDATLIERLSRNFGTTTKIYRLADGRFVARECIHRDERGTSRCKMNQAN
jgi:hypothetical protein